MKVLGGVEPSSPHSLATGVAAIPSSEPGVGADAVVVMALPMLAPALVVAPANPVQQTTDTQASGAVQARQMPCHQGGRAVQRSNEQGQQFSPASRGCRSLYAAVVQGAPNKCGYMARETCGNMAQVVWLPGINGSP
jgi:hypothetical protein